MGAPKSSPAVIPGGNAEASIKCWSVSALIQSNGYMHEQTFWQLVSLVEMDFQVCRTWSISREKNIDTMRKANGLHKVKTCTTETGHTSCTEIRSSPQERG